MKEAEKAMDSDSFEADRNVLKKLYSLLQINESSEQSALSEILDAQSLSFLKKLLDDAAERMFEAHIKIMVDNWRSELGTNNLGQLEEAKVPPERSHLAAESSNLNQRNAELTEKPSRMPSLTSRLRRFTSELQSRRKQRYLTCQQSRKLEETNKTVARSSNRTTPEKQVEDKAAKVEQLSNKVDVAMASIELLIPSLNRLAKPIHGLASSSQIGGPVQNLVDNTTTGTKAYQEDCKKNKYTEKSKERVGLARLDEVEPRGEALRKKTVDNNSIETWSESPDSESSWTTVSSSSSASSWTTIQGSESESSRNSPDYESSRTQYYTSSQSSSTEYDTSSSRSQSSGGHRKAGKLARLKNKLGLIFHHSHHHRPHKNNSVWKRFGKRKFRETGKNGKGKIPNKTGRKQKALAKYNGGNHKKGKQIGQLRTLAKGFFRHVKQPKVTKLHGKKTNLWLNRVRITTNKPRLKLRGKPKKPKLTNFSETH